MGNGTLVSSPNFGFGLDPAGGDMSSSTKCVITILEIVIWKKMPFQFQFSNSNKLKTVHGLYAFLIINLFVQHNPILSYISISAQAHESVCYNLRVTDMLVILLLCLSSIRVHYMHISQC